MLCTRMRLTERRFSIPRESSEDDPQASTGIIQRPCVVRNLASNCTSDVMTPRITDRSKTSSRKGKPPLVVFSLKMQPGIKTLVQNDIKRDPRKLPPFCGQYNKQEKKIRTTTDNSPTADLIVRGVEILSYPNPQNDQDSDSSNEATTGTTGYVPRELQIQLTECCQCMRDITFLRTEMEIERAFPGDSKYLRVHNPPMTRSLSRFLGEKRAPSPRTRQVISITVNSKKEDS